MEDSSFETLRQRVKEYIQTEDPRDAIANIEDELEDILEQLFDELSTPKDTPIPVMPRFSTLPKAVISSRQTKVCNTLCIKRPTKEKIHNLAQKLSAANSE